MFYFTENIGAIIYINISRSKCIVHLCTCKNLYIDYLFVLKNPTIIKPNPTSGLILDLKFHNHKLYNSKKQ